MRPIPLSLYTAGVASVKFTKSEDESLILLFLLHSLSPQLLFSSPQTTPTQLPPLSSFGSSADKKQLFIPSSSAESLKPLTVEVGGTVEFVRQIVQLVSLYSLLNLPVHNCEPEENDMLNSVLCQSWI